MDYTTELLRYDGDSPVPLWYDENKSINFTFRPKRRLIYFSDMFKESCVLHADLSELICDRTLVRPLFKKPYWRVEFDVELKFGTTELEAAIVWKVNVNTLLLSGVSVVLTH